MRKNTKPVSSERTHEGAVAPSITAYAALRRSVLACLLWEDEFYEDGESIAERIISLARQVEPEKVASIAVEARHGQHLRHAPLLLASVLARYHGAHRTVVENTIASVIDRADEITELLAIHASVNGVGPGEIKKTIPAAMKRGIARAFRKFDEYQLAKYDRDTAIKLRDAMRLCHPKPEGDAQAALWKRVLDRTLATPDTWETQLSGGADKREIFERLIRDGKLGYLALLRNLRGMMTAGCDPTLVREAIRQRKGAQRVLPFRYVAAARACPQLEPAIDSAFMAALADLPILPGRTIVLVDVSGSMQAKLSAKSDMTRLDAAAALTAMLTGDRRVFSFSARTVEVAPRNGMAGIDAIISSQGHGGTALGPAIQHVNGLEADRLIVITDEQATAEPIPAPLFGNAYMINVASNQNGVGYRNGWIHIDGWSENVLRFVHANEFGTGGLSP